MNHISSIGTRNIQRVDALRKALLRRNRKIARLDDFQPVSGLGRHALVLTEQVAAISAMLQAVTTYTNVIITTTVPPASFTSSPTNTPGISVTELQSEYQTFTSQWARMQGTADLWINTNPNTGEPSILSQLTSVPATLTGLDPTVQYYLTMLQGLPESSSTYQQDLDTLQGLVGAQASYATNLASQVEDFGQSMQTQTDAVVTQVTTGVIAEVIEAYQSEIDTLNDNIDALNDQIASDNRELIEDYGAIGADAIITVQGVSMIWMFPAGFMMIGAGIYGIYEAATDISHLKAEIASDAAMVTTETSVVSQDTSEMSNLQAFANSVQGYTALNATAQQELITLANMYEELAAYLGTMNTDLSENEITTAADEWNQIMASANALVGVTLYVWPSNAQLFAPNTMAPTADGVFVISNSGTTYYCANGAQTWTTVSGKALSILATDEAIIKINGAPANGSTSVNPYDTDYTVCKYNPSADSWMALSTFPASNIATDGSAIYCTQQSSGADNQYVYQYTGSGTSWTQLPALPNNQAPRYLAVAGGALFIATFNQGVVYKYENSGWTRISPDGVIAVSLTAANGYIGYIDQHQKSYLYNAAGGQSPEQSGEAVIGLGQVNSDAQYQIDSAQALSIAQMDNGPPQTTQLQQNVISIATGYDTGVPVYCDNKGAIFRLDGSQSQGHYAWIQLPALPSGS